MRPEWTDEQKDAINAGNASVIVSAAAGSGKTSVLVERLLRILSDAENAVPAERIIVVTFTTDAAAQMKQRLSAALSEKLMSEPDNRWLARQQAMIPSAKISTIHSFCFDMIRENIQPLDISAGFRIIDSAEEALIEAEATGNVFEKMYAEQPDMMRELSDFTGSADSDSALEKTVGSIRRFLGSQPFPDEWLDNAVSRYGKPFDEKNDPLAGLYAVTVSDMLLGIAGSAGTAAALCASVGSCEAINVLLGEKDRFEQMAKKALDTGLEWDKRFELPAVKWETAKYPKVTEGTEDAGKIAKAKSLRDSCKRKYEKISSEYKFTKNDIADDFAVNFSVIKKLSVLVKAVSEEVWRLKCEKNALGFSDAEQLSVKLLCEKDSSGRRVKSPLAKELSEFYKIVMIDEFQDANNTQSLIFRMLSHKGTEDKNGDNFFAVGDVKQSIYGFRLANPGNFISALSSAEPYSKDFKGDSAAVLLNMNFRSSNDVVDYVNDIFGDIMTVRTGGVDYLAGHQLVAGAGFPVNGAGGSRATEYILVDTDGAGTFAEDTGGDDDSEEPLTDESAEAFAAAVKIKEMLGKAEVFENGKTRKCECRDFCILLRDKKRGQLYADALSSLGVKAVCAETAGYLESREISVLMNLLTVIDDPMKDIPLVSVLMSPMFMLTAEEAAELRLIKRGCHMYKCVLEAADENGGAGYSAKNKLLRFKKIYDDLRICAASQSLERLIRTIYDSTGFLSSVQAYSDGDQKKANLRLLLEYAKSYEQNSAGGLGGFIRYIQNIAESGGDFVRASVVSQTENAVSVKTIHKSKGLEYPFVFLCGTLKGFNLTDTYERMQINLDLGIGFKINDRKTLRSYTSFPQFVISRENGREVKREEMRLMYVALTRAKEKIFITVPMNEKTEDRISSLCGKLGTPGSSGAAAADAGSMFDWLMAELLSHPGGKKLRGNSAVAERNSAAEIRTVKMAAPSVLQASAVKAVPAKPDGEKVKKLIEKFSFDYGSRLPDTLARLTITEIAKGESGEVFLRRPDFSSYGGKLTPAEKGTAMHTFMQYADYTAAEKDVRGQAELLEQKGILTEEEKNSLSCDKLEAFFRSPLYERMKNSPEIRREQKFLIEISKLGLDDELGKEYNNTEGMLQGIADCFFAEGDGIVIVDYKTDSVDSEKVLADRYRRQLVLYSRALGLIFGRKVNGAYLYSFALGREVKIL